MFPFFCLEAWKKEYFDLIQKKIINKNAIIESLISFKRAGANAIISYYADRIDQLLR